MNRFFGLVLKQRYKVLALGIVLMAWSLWTLTKVNISAVPDISNKQVMINTKTGSLSTEQIEKIVTYPIEIEMSGLPGVDEVRSLSKYGLSQVIVVFEDDVNIYFARQLISEKLQSAKSAIPDGLSAELGPVSTGLGEIFMWILELNPDSPRKSLSEKEQLQYLRRIQEFTIRPRLKRLPGVAEVDTNGGFNTEVHINYDPDRLRRFGLNVHEIIDALKDTGTSFGGSYIKSKGEQITVRSLVKISDLRSIEEIAIKRLPSGRNVLVKDIGSVKFESVPRVGGATFNGNETVLGTILMRVGANSRQVANLARKSLDTLNLPEDVHLKVVYNREYLVEKTIQTVAKNLIEGAALVIIVLLIILGNFRASLIVSLAIPFSMAIALKGMQLFGISANLMSLGAIDFGLLVDASVVLVENFLRRMGEGGGPLNPKQRFDLLVQSSSEIAKPVIFGLIIIMLVYVPILSLEGVEGKMFEPMALTVLMALAASLAVALFIVPILLYFTFRKRIPEKHPAIFKYIQKSYEPSLNFTLKHKKSALAVAVSLFLISVFTFLHLGSDFVPQLDEGDLVIGIIRDSKQNIDQSIADQKIAESIIKEFGEVDYVFSRIGTPESATDPMSPNFADTFVILKKDLSQWPKINGQHRSKSELFTAISKKLKATNPDQEVSATQPIEMRFNEILEGSRADITLRFLGPDLDKLIEYAEISQDALKDVNGLQSIEFEALTGLTKSPVLDIEIDPKKALEYDLNPSEVNQYIQSSLAGINTGTYFLNGIQIPFIFHLDESIRNDIQKINQLPVPLNEGGTIPLNRIATLNLKDKVTTIARRWAERYSAVSIYISGRDVASFVDEAKQRIDSVVRLDPGYNIEWGGQFKNLERARKKLLIIVPITLFGIFFLVYTMTNSFLQTATIFTSVPLGLAGGVILLFLRDMNFSVSAAVGFIALSGIVVLNSLVLVNSINQLFLEFGEPDRAIRTGALSRLRPVTMTALVAGLGFLPMAFNTGMGSEVQRPLATVVLGGLFSSTLLTMLVVPVLLSYVFKIKQVRRKKG